MTPRERVLRTLSGEKPNKVPYEFGLTPKLQEEFEKRTGAKNPAKYYDFDIRSVKPAATQINRDFSQYLPELPEGTTVDEWGVAQVPGSEFHFTKRIHPLRELTEVGELKDYPFPDRDADYRFEGMKEEIDRLHEEGYFVDGFVGHIFETAWYMRGMENLLMDFYRNEEFANHLLDKITEMNIAVAEKMAILGCDMVRFGDDVGTQQGMMMDPQIWRKFLKPRLAKEIEKVRQINPDIHVWYHSDGDISRIIGELLEIGVDILNPVQPECMDLLQIKEEYGDKLNLWGTIGTQSTMPFGTTEEVRETVKNNIEKLGYNGRLVLAPTHVLEPDVPWENVEAFIEVCEEF